MNSKHPSAVQILRHAIQLIAFLLFPELFITVLHALGDVVSSLTSGTFSLASLSSQLITLGAVLVITAVWGRFFCGYLCSFGALQELFFRLAQRICPRRPRIPARLDRALGYLKYVVLACIAAAFWVLALPMNASWSPWGIFGMLISGNPSIMASAVPTLGFALLLVFLIGSLFVDRFFCRYFCPLGALFTLISAKRHYKIRRDTSACTNCGLCERQCSMGIPILQKDAVTSGNCIDCMQCLTGCPKQCLSANPTPVVAETAAAITMCGLIQIGSLTVPDDLVQLGTSQFDAAEQGSYPDGVYTGTGAGFRGDTQVQVTVENGYISDITVLSYEDDAQFFQKAQSSVLSQILSEQSVDVQSVTGATFSSRSIIDAVADALGIEAQAETGDALQGQDPEPSAEWPQGESGDTGDSQESASSPLDLSSVENGTYQGTGEGFRGTTTLSVTVEEGKITDITVVSYEDDEPFFTRAEDTMIDAIIGAQSLDVQTVSGATFSSNGILEAVADALGAQFDNPNQSAPKKGGHEKGEMDKTRPEPRAPRA